MVLSFLLMMDTFSFSSRHGFVTLFQEVVFVILMLRFPPI